MDLNSGPIDPRTKDETLISNTIKAMLENKNMLQPLEISRLMECAEKITIPFMMYFDKIYGRWIVTSMGIESVREHTQTHFNGSHFFVIEASLEWALARAIHYFYHTQMRGV